MNVRSLLITASLMLTSGLMIFSPIKSDTKALTPDECLKAQKVAVDFFEMAKKNTKLYPTVDDAKKAAQRYFAKRIKAELGDSTRPTPGDYTDAVEHCRRKTAADISKLIGLLGATALKGAPSPKAR